jgi:DNA polymerase III subunit gamma/tau
VQTQPSPPRVAPPSLPPAPDTPRPAASPAVSPDDVRPGPVRTAARTAAPAAEKASLQDLRAHPLYQEATKMWSGRVKEIGKVKQKAPDEAVSEADLPEVLAEEELV